MTDKARAEIVAGVIYEQLGGSKFIAMTGAKNLIFGTDGLGSLSFSIGRNSSKANRVKITLAGSDTYTVRFSRFTAPKVTKMFNDAGEMLGVDVVMDTDKELKLIDGVYANMLREVFTGFTGLYTSLRG
jgi:hypothetical protein